MASKTFGFGLAAMKKYPELVPLVGIISTACVGCCAFMGYALATKPDVTIMKSSGPRYQNVGSTEYRKLIRLNQEVYAFPEIDKLRKEINSYKS